MADDLFEFAAVRRVYAVMGSPVAHSKSPEIHAMFSRETGIALEYTAIHVDRGGFTAAVRNFHANGGTGLNVTLPFKAEAFRLADTHSERAARAGTANTLRLDDDGSVYADNTDGPGLVTDIVDNVGVPLDGRRILLLGAGGAARGVLGPLLDAAPAALVVANRTPGRAADMARDFAASGAVSSSGFAALGKSRFDVVINATSASLAGDLPPIPEHCVAGAALAYDMMYANEPTVFMQWASRAGAGRVCDGLGMLVEQAAESFRLWHGVRPRTTSVIEALRQRPVTPYR